MTRELVRDLVQRRILRVEDGNHGNDRPRPDEFEHAGVAFIRAADMTSGTVDFDGAGKINITARTRIRKGIGAPGDVILSHKGTVGRVAVAPADSPEYVCSPQTTFWRSLDHDVLDQRYLRYVLTSNDFARQLDVLKGQTDMAPYVSLTDQRSMEIEVPLVEQQLAIAEVLGALDDKIAANDRVVSLLLELAHSGYLQALAAGPTVVMPLLDAFDIDFGEAFKGDLFSEPGIGRPLIRIRDLKTLKPQTWTTEIRPREVEVLPGDVLVGMDAEFRASCWLGTPGMLNQRTCRVRGKETGAGLVIEALRKPLAVIENEKSATTVIHLNKSDLARTKVEIPSAGPLATFEALAEPLVRSRVAIALETRSLAETRDALLPLLMSGKVRISDAQTIVEGVV